MSENIKLVKVAIEDVAVGDVVQFSEHSRGGFEVTRSFTRTTFTGLKEATLWYKMGRVVEMRTAALGTIVFIQP